MYTLPSLKPFSDLDRYFSILSPEKPTFLEPYIESPLVQRLRGVGLLCGTDWTPLYHNRFFYTRFHHSIGTALITWHFTKSKKQTIASLLHDVSTPAFSHVSDFRKGDALTQEATESENSQMIESDPYLSTRVFEDGLYAKEISDYHKYAICDNEVPRLSSDRLEYMFPSGMALDASWDIAAVERAYNDITVLQAEDGTAELGFTTAELAADYCARACSIGLILQKNENKLALNLMGDIINTALKAAMIEEHDLYEKSEEELMKHFGAEASRAPDTRFAALFRTFTGMTAIQHTDTPLSGAYCVSLDVKKRYINPLVRTPDGAKRVTAVSAAASAAVQQFLAFNDTKYGCVTLL